MWFEKINSDCFAHYSILYSRSMNSQLITAFEISAPAIRGAAHLVTCFLKNV